MALGTISLSTYLVYFFLYHPDVQICYTRSRLPNLAKCDPAADNPVCALYYGGDCHAASGFCKKTVSNQCAACLDRSVIAVLPGGCDQNKFQKCGDQSNVKCDPTFQEPVCAFVKEEGCISQLFPRTVVNSCVACSYDDTIFYHKGNCPEYGPTICRGDARYPQLCTLEYSPYCTYYREKGQISRQTSSNFCTSCLGSEAVFNVPGYCEPEDDQFLQSEPEIVEIELQVPEFEGST